MWAIFPMQDLLSMDEGLRRALQEEERINVPAVVNHYWKYRLHLTLEQLLSNESFTETLAQKIDEADLSTYF